MNTRLTALDFISGCLSVHSVADADRTLRAVIKSGRLDWHAVIDLADTHLISPALSVALRNRGLAGELPSNVHEHLWKTHLLNTLRNKRFKEQAVLAVRALNSIGIEPMLLKGGASLFDNTFGDPGSRVMSDLDILVPQKNADDCWNTLRSNGYIPIEIDFDYSRHHHLRPLFRPGDQGTIEIHREALPSSAAAIMPTAQIWRHAQSVIESGAVFRVPDPTIRILHNVLHAALVNRGYARGEISLRSLHELALIQNQHENQIDWMAIRTLMDRGGKSKVLNAWLYAAHRLFAFRLLPGVRPKMHALAHYTRMRVQARWRWTDEIIERAMRFSVPDICEKYQCTDDFVSVAKGRMRLAVTMSCCGAIQAFLWARRGFQNRRSAQRAGQTGLENQKQQQRT